MQHLEFIWKSLQRVYSNKRYFVFNIPFLIFSKSLESITKYKVYDDVLAFTMKTQIYDRSRGIRGAYSNIIQQYPGWDYLFQQWLNSSPLKNTQSFLNAFRHFLAYLDIEQHGDHPINFMSQKRKVEFSNYLKDVPIKKKSDVHAKIFKFTCWIVDEHMSGVGEYIATRTQIAQFNKQAKKK